MNKLLFIISGSIAAKKALESVKILRDKGYSVTCLVTKSAEEFISYEEAYHASGNKVYRALFSSGGADDMDHINLSRNNDLIVVAPASANLIAKMAQGLADDLASATLLAADKPIMIAPAMNMKMWDNKATQRNIEIVRADGVRMIGPADGDLACGEVGPGRMKEADQIADAVDGFFQNRELLKGVKALVTSGPTIEEMDPVRYISNHSSGKQGHAVAQKLADAGAKVTLISGPVNIPDPAGVKVIKVKSAEQMLRECKKSLPADVAVFAAAVADWKIKIPAKNKMKKQPGAEEQEIKLVQNTDILKTIASGKPRPKLVVGFAAETDNLLSNAKKKLQEKQCDWIIANDISKGVFGSDDNEVTFISKDRNEKWPKQNKSGIANKLVLKIAAQVGKK